MLKSRKMGEKTKKKLEFEGDEKAKRKKNNNK